MFACSCMSGIGLMSVCMHRHVLCACARTCVQDACVCGIVHVHPCTGRLLHVSAFPMRMNALELVGLKGSPHHVLPGNQHLVKPQCFTSLWPAVSGAGLQTIFAGSRCNSLRDRDVHVLRQSRRHGQARFSSTHSGSTLLEVAARGRVLLGDWQTLYTLAS